MYSNYSGQGPLPADEIPIFIKNLVGKNQILEAIEMLKVSFLGSRKTYSYDAVILVESRWRDIVQRESSGVLSLEEVDKEKLSIKKGLLGIVNTEFGS